MHPLIHHLRSSAIADSSVLSDEEKAVLIESLPLFSLASLVAMLPNGLTMLSASPPSTLTTSFASSPPATTLSTPPASTPGFDPPLYRSSITLPTLPLKLPAAAATAKGDPSKSSSFRIEIGSISRWRTLTKEDAVGAATSLPALPPPPPPPPQQELIKAYRAWHDLGMAQPKMGHGPC